MEKKIEELQEQIEDIEYEIKNGSISKWDGSKHIKDLRKKIANNETRCSRPLFILNTQKDETEALAELLEKHIGTYSNNLVKSIARDCAVEAMNYFKNRTT